MSSLNHEKRERALLLSLILYDSFLYLYESLQNTSIQIQVIFTFLVQRPFSFQLVFLTLPVSCHRSTSMQEEVFTGVTAHFDNVSFAVVDSGGVSGLTPPSTRPSPLF